MDEDEIAHLNNPPVAPRARSPAARGQRRGREPTEEDYLNPRVWRRRPLDGAHYMTPPRDFHPSDDEDEEAFVRSRQRPACQPQYIPQRLRRQAPNVREPEPPHVNAPPVNHEQASVREPWERVRVRVRNQDGMFNGERLRAPTPMPARPLNDENMEPEGPRMRSISLEPRARRFFQDGDGAAAPPPVYVPAARPMGNLPKIQMHEFQGKKGVPAQMWLESVSRFQNLYQLTDAQLLEVARFSCKGEYATLWAGLLPTDLSLQNFKEPELFKAEFAVENHDKLMAELLKATQ